MSELILVRHCESSGQGPEAPLSPKGFEQAERLADFLAPLEPDHIVSSPYRRALQTIEPFAGRVGLPVRSEPRIRERRLSGEPLDDWRDHLRRTWEDFDYRAPGGETSREAQERGRAAFDEVVASGHRRALLASHGNLLGLLIQTIDPTFDFARWESLTFPDVFRVRRVGSGHAVERLWRE